MSMRKTQHFFSMTFGIQGDIYLDIYAYHDDFVRGIFSGESTLKSEVTKILAIKSNNLLVIMGD